MDIVKRQLAGMVLIAFLVLFGWVVLPDPLLMITSGLNTPWFPLILIGLYLIRPLFIWPIVAISTIVGYRYGLTIGLPIALFGTVFTSALPYYVGRYTQTDHGLLGTATNTASAYFDTVGDLRGLIAARLAPTPAEPISIAAGLSSITLPTFIIGTLIGELPWTITAVLIGTSLHQLTRTDLAITNPWLIIGGTLTALILLAGPIYRYVKHTTNTNQSLIN